MTDDTVWASGYTNAGFKSIRLGMHRDEVHKRLGEPIQALLHPATGELWEFWTCSPNDGDYWRREIVYQKEHVTRKFGELYID